MIGEYEVSQGARIATRMSAPTITIPATREPLRYQGRKRAGADGAAGMPEAGRVPRQGVAVIGLPPC